MSDMIRFEDMDKDGRLGLNEFYAAFSKLYSKYNIYIQKVNYKIRLRRRDFICLRCILSNRIYKNPL